MKRQTFETMDRHLGGDKIVLLDIGARYGVHPRWKPFAPHLRVYAFEPDPEECARINESARSLDYDLECLPYALGSGAREAVPLYVCEDPGCSSLYQPNMDLVREFYFGDKMRVARTLNVSINMLSAVCAERGIEPDVLKIDTQGYELEILKGAGFVLQRVKLVEVEVEFNEQYKDQPLFSDLDLYMRSMGFALLGLRRTYWRRKVNRDELRSPFGGQIMHGDAVYYNRRLLDDRGESLPLKDILKFCALLSAYEQDDFVAYLCTQPHPALNPMGEEDRLRLAVELKTRGSKLGELVGRLLDAVRKRIWLPHAALRGALDKVQSRHAQDWHDPNFY